MELGPYIATLREQLITAAAAGDENTQNVAKVLAAAVEPAARLAIMNALSDLAAEITVALEDRVVDLRLSGQDVRVVVTDTPTDDHGPQAQPPPSAADGDITRITVRLLEELKGKAEQAAAAQGMSLNSFVAQAVQGALHRRGPGRGRGPWSGWENDPNGDHKQWAGGRESSRVRGWVQG